MDDIFSEFKNFPNHHKVLILKSIYAYVCVTKYKILMRKVENSSAKILQPKPQKWEYWAE